MSLSPVSFSHRSFSFSSRYRNQQKQDTPVCLCSVFSLFFHHIPENPTGFRFREDSLTHLGSMKSVPLFEYYRTLIVELKAFTIEGILASMNLIFPAPEFDCRNVCQDLDYLWL